MKSNEERRRITPLLSFEKPDRGDLAVIGRQMQRKKFNAELVLGVACRCIWGFPQVLISSPLLGGKPFPTTFWLSCPFLTRKCAILESSGGVADLEQELLPLRSEWVKYHLLHSLIRQSLCSPAESRFLRLRRRGMWRALCRGGIGGIVCNERVTVKCLHLQMASWLALGAHPGQRWLEKQISDSSCQNPGHYGCAERPQRNL